MAITYEVNSTAITGGIKAHWPPMETAKLNDGLPEYSFWYRHIWAIESLDMTDYLFLEGLRGTVLTQLKTTDKDTPNSTGTYATGRVMTVSGQQRGRQMLNVLVNFLVDAS